MITRRSDYPKQQSSSLLKPILISTALITGLISIWAYTQNPTSNSKTAAFRTETEDAIQPIIRSHPTPKTVPGTPTTPSAMKKTQPSIGKNQVYSWVDKNGQKHYSDTKHRGASIITVSPNVVTYAPTSKSAYSRSSGNRVYHTASAQRRSTSNPKYNGKSCSRLRNALEKVRSRMRAGYKAKQYNKLASKERKLSDEIYKHC